MVGLKVELPMIKVYPTGVEKVKCSYKNFVLGIDVCFLKDA